MPEKDKNRMTNESTNNIDEVADMVDMNTDDNHQMENKANSIDDRSLTELRTLSKFMQ